MTLAMGREVRQALPEPAEVAELGQRWVSDPPGVWEVTRTDEGVETWTAAAGATRAAGQGDGAGDAGGGGGDVRFVRLVTVLLVPAVAVVVCVAALNEPPLFPGLYWREVFVWTIAGVLVLAGLGLMASGMQDRRRVRRGGGR